MTQRQNWKDHLLKSGIPLEFEIKKFLDGKGCISNFEYTYFRNNESNLDTEFSYDIDSSLIIENHFVDFMIECKYRHESTKWVFLPEEYGGPDEIEHISFMHRNGHFNTMRHSIFEFPVSFAPLCSKGIELTSEGQNPKSITQAITQLSYAMAGRIVEGMHHQIDDVLRENWSNVIFYNIPIIITTADLYRIKDNVGIDTIKASSDICDISTKEPYLIIKCKPSIELETFNNDIFSGFISEYSAEKLDKYLNTFNKGVEFVMSVIAKHYSPTCIVVVQYSKDDNGLENLFTYINRVFHPDQEILDLLEKKKEKMKEFMAKFKLGKF